MSAWIQSIIADMRSINAFAYFKKLEKSSDTASQPGQRQRPLTNKMLLLSGILEETEASSNLSLEKRRKSQETPTTFEVWAASGHLSSGSHPRITESGVVVINVICDWSVKEPTHRDSWHQWSSAVDSLSSLGGGAEWKRSTSVVKKTREHGLHPARPCRCLWLGKKHQYGPSEKERMSCRTMMFLRWTPMCRTMLLSGSCEGNLTQDWRSLLLTAQTLMRNIQKCHLDKTSQRQRVK